MKIEKFMKIALEEAKLGDAPYGAVIVKDNQVIIKAHNTVETDNDPTAHAELNAIRCLTKEIKNPSLEGYTLYTTCEPCPMCTTACIWAGISEIIFGASIQDLIEAGVPQLDLSSEEIIKKGSKRIKVTKGILKEEALQLFNHSCG
ncbi:nucleoside deaminase [Coleofasciculus sp. FACHB-64]|uniref:nucleoside deaminase n=1 Tax=Cyanophyceae TaxID=3028117 RepID=UPI0016884EF7|nr:MULTISPECIES: nucleoside deaminase [unclassified Coleofasciculus]MBD1839845.1 nucleoside deaminase [Coleofasciculus sp. FACHB-501]MBD1900074.1 nucleoside deaminase [Coleofasciculus sp. FACHB-125]MBD2044580.1 nucleoside deaminase [Coleofasciculus sp. FACHB-64]